VLLAAIIFKALVELALVALLGQGLLFVLAGSSRHTNLVYKLFAIVTAPIMKAARFVTPRFIVDQHIGFVAFFLLLALWVAALALKVHFYVQQAAGAA
jgi:hypothetical protein